MIVYVGCTSSVGLARMKNDRFPVKFGKFSLLYAIISSAFSLPTLIFMIYLAMYQMLCTNYAMVHAANEEVISCCLYWNTISEFYRKC
jgi:hypothetical protein